MKNQKKSEMQKQQNPLRATVCMWIIAVILFLFFLPMIVLSPSLGFVLESCILAIPTLGTLSVLSHRQSVNTISPEIEKLKERLGNLETIASHDELKGDRVNDEIQVLMNQINNL